jgi:hypothetical protein
MLTFTPTEESLLKALPKPVQQAMIHYPSVAENYLRCHALPLVPEGHPFNFFEIYYDCQELPILDIKQGVSRPTSPRTSNQPPVIIEMVGDDDVVFIQVAGHVILNRTNGNLPDIYTVLL